VNTLARLRGRSRVWKNYYASLWEDSTASARYALESWPRLRDGTLCFRDALFASSLPDEALDAVSANLSILKSPTVLRLPDGTLYGFEGTLERDGCCEGSCNHVWNYVQSTAFLFPSLERSMRSANYRYTQDADGALQYRLILPLGSTRLPYRPCADGQFGEVMQAYRDWRICGDDSWLRELWPHIKRSIAYAWSEKNADRWDPERTGVLWGRQHHTLDMDLFGPNAWLTGFYLGALKAAAEMAQHFGEPETAGEYRGLFDKGKSWIEGHLFNGEYYQQQVDLDHPSTLEGLGRTTLMDRFTPPAFRNTYWSEEHGEVARQIGAGCAIDQVLAQSHATLYGLGEIFDPEQVRSALRSIYTYNFKSEMREHWNPDRIFALGDEGGLVICEWPAHVRRPGLPINYASETFNGCEYAAATHMIQMGLVEEGMACVRAVRHRYDGERRNPWNEIECGGNYARSMASYALLNAFSGLQFDMRRRVIGFAPVRRDGESFRCFWSLDPAWGEVEIDDEAIELRVLAGCLPLAGLVVPLGEQPDLGARLGGVDLAFRRDGEAVCFEEPIEIAAGCALRLARRSAPLLR
jgi:uncharacterized protein (DUF608 family)